MRQPNSIAIWELAGSRCYCLGANNFQERVRAILDKGFLGKLIAMMGKSGTSGPRIPEVIAGAVLHGIASVCGKNSCGADLEVSRLYRQAVAVAMEARMYKLALEILRQRCSLTNAKELAIADVVHTVARFMVAPDAKAGAELSESLKPPATSLGWLINDTLKDAEMMKRLAALATSILVSPPPLQDGQARVGEAGQEQVTPCFDPRVLSSHMRACAVVAVLVCLYDETLRVHAPADTHREEVRKLGRRLTRACLRHGFHMVVYWLWLTERFHVDARTLKGAEALLGGGQADQDRGTLEWARRHTARLIVLLHGGGGDSGAPSYLFMRLASFVESHDLSGALQVVDEMQLLQINTFLRSRMRSEYMLAVTYLMSSKTRFVDALMPRMLQTPLGGGTTHTCDADPNVAMRVWVVVLGLSARFVFDLPRLHELAESLAAWGEPYNAQVLYAIADAYPLWNVWHAQRHIRGVFGQAWDVVLHAMHQSIRCLVAVMANNAPAKNMTIPELRCKIYIARKWLSVLFNEEAAGESGAEALTLALAALYMQLSEDELLALLEQDMAVDIFTRTSVRIAYYCSLSIQAKDARGKARDEVRRALGV